MERECRECGEDIGEQRLKVKPDATMCIECQQKAEREGRFRKHRMDYKVIPNGGNEVETMETFLVRGTAT